MAGVMKWAKRLTFGVALLFLIELIFGFTGTVIMVHGTAIRTVLFALSAVLLYGYCLLYVIVHRVPVISKERESVLGSFKFHDWAFFALTVSTAISLFVIPRLSGGSLTLAKNEAFNCLCMMLYYFPLGFLIRRKELSFLRLEQILRVLLFLFSLEHIFFYIGQSIYGSFIDEMFDLIRSVVGESAVLPEIILGHGGYARVMFITSIYILAGMYLVFRRLPKFTVADGLMLGVHVTALLATITKSLWYGVIIGLFAFSVCYIIYWCRKKNAKHTFRFLGILAGMFALVLILNATIFNNMIAVRMSNSFTTTETASEDEDEEDEEDYLAALDRAGAAISNDIKIEQTEKLLNKWLTRPLYGYGYGSYITGYLRSYDSPQSYEMQLPALLMKTGIIGVGLLVLAILAMIISLCKAAKKYNDPISVFAWLFLLLAFGFTVQTNPLLLSYNGISMVIFLMMIVTDAQQPRLPHPKGA